MISREGAIHLARQAIQGLVRPQEGSPITVDLRDGQYVVTFVHVNPPDTLGPDFDARVTIDAESGDVLDILGGP